MGLFSKILPALEVVGGVALIATGAGALAGGMLITQGLVSSGVIGGSIGKFLKSDLGQGLMLATSLGSTAYAMYGQSALQTSLTEMNQGVADEIGKMGAEQAVQASQASADTITGALAKTGVSFSDSIGVNTAAFPDATTAAYNGAPVTEMTGSSAVANNINPQANLAQTQALGETQNAVAQASGHNMPGLGEGGSFNGSAPAGNTGQPTGNFGTPPAQPQMTGPQPGTNMPDASAPTAGAPNAAGHADFASAEGGDAEGGNFLDKLAGNKFLNSKFGSAAIQGAGSAIGGLGQGMMQQASMDKQLAYLREPNQSFGGPAGKGVIAAAQGPITVPSGYLQRAAALKQMLGSNGAGAVPSASSPVPVWGMGSTPRGGVAGG